MPTWHSPPTGNGPFPLIVLLHGLGVSKAEFEDSTDDGASRRRHVGLDGVRGLDVHGPAASGHRAGRRPAAAEHAGLRQGVDPSRPTSVTRSATRSIWPGMLVDEGLVKPAIAVSGVSYGGGQSLGAGHVEEPDAPTDRPVRPFTSPVHHVPMQVAAALRPCGRGTTLATSLVPNGWLSTTRAHPVRGRRPAGRRREAELEHPPLRWHRRSGTWRHRVRHRSRI